MQKNPSPLFLWSFQIVFNVNLKAVQTISTHMLLKSEEQTKCCSFEEMTVGKGP